MMRLSIPIQLSIPLLAGVLLLSAPKSAHGQKYDPNQQSSQPAEKPSKSADSGKSSDSGKDSSKSSNGEQKPKLTGEQKWLLAIQSQLKASEDEWTVLAPRLQRVIKLQQEANAGRDPKGPRPPKNSNPKPPSEGSAFASTAMHIADLRERAGDLNLALLDPDAPVSDIRVKLAAVREARAKAKRDLAVAQDELRQLLTYRQEAVLLVMGLLD